MSFIEHGDHTTLTVKDAHFGDHVPLRVRAYDRLTGEPVTIGLGDQIAWEGNVVYWTSKSLLGIAPGLACPQAREVRLPRVGYLG